MHGKERFVSCANTVVGAVVHVFNSDCPVTLTIGKTVLQPIEPTVGKKDPRSQFFYRIRLRMFWMILQRWSLLQRDLSMAVGKVKWFNNAKGYGFIVEDGKDEDLFAHYSAIKMDGYKTLKAGQAVVFDLIQGPKGLHAIEIKNLVIEPSGAAESAAMGAAAATANAPAKALS